MLTVGFYAKFPAENSGFTLELPRAKPVAEKDVAAEIASLLRGKSEKKIASLIDRAKKLLKSE